MLKSHKAVNDRNKHNTYLIRRKSGDSWYADELCMLREAFTESFRLFRPMDGNLYEFNEKDLNKFIIVSVID